MIASVGYSDTVDDAQWAQWAPHLGMRLWVGGAGDLAPSVVSASARQVRVAAGTAGGSGVMDVLDTAESVTLSPLASGSRVDVVALRRSWTPTGTPTGTTSVVVVTGASLTVALAALRRTPGTVEGADQPLAAFQVATSGANTSVSLLEDMRLWAGNGGIVAVSTASLAVLDEPGTTVRIGADTWTRVVEGGSAWWSRSSASLIVAGEGVTGTSTAGQPVVQSGSLVANSDQTGHGRITWPRPFGVALTSLVLFNGDDQAAPGFRMTPSGNQDQWGSQAVGDRTGVVYVLVDAADRATPGRRHRVNWIATGLD